MKKLLYTLLFLSLILTNLNTFTQNREEIKDLLEQLEVEKEEISRIQIYKELSRKYISLNPDSALIFANKGLYRAKQINDLNGIGALYAIMGDVRVIQNDLYLSKENYLKAIDYYIKTKNSERQANVYLVLGNISFVQDNYPEALNYYIKGKNIADSLQLIKLLPDFYNNIGNIYFRLNDVKMTLEYFSLAQELFEMTGKHDQIPIVLTNMITIHLSLNEFEKATSLANRVIYLADSIPGIKYLKTSGFTQLGNIKFKKGNYLEALDYYHQSLHSIVDIGKDYMGPKSIELAAVHFNIGKCYVKLNNNPKAKEYLLEAYKLADENGQLGVLADVSELLTQLYEKEGNLVDALNYHKMFKRINDSISNDQTLKKVTQIKLQYEIAENLKEQELQQSRKEAQQKRRELILFMVIAGIFIGLVLFILLYLLQKNKAKRIDLKHKNLKLDLDYKNKELTTNVMYLLKKNEFIINISNKLKKSRYDFKPENRATIDEILREIESSSKEVNWKDFELRFQEVHSSFYKKLNKEYPDLSPNELKLCAFLRLNMSTKEISAITFQSYDSIMMARYRLRKKMNIDSHENLISSLNKL